MVNKKYLLKHTIIFLFLILGAIKVFAYDNPIIQDDADLLTPEQEELLINDMMPITKYGSVMFVSNGEDHPVYNAADLAEEICKNNFHGDSSVIFLIDMYNRRIEIYSDGDIYKVIGKMWATSITDNIYTYATYGDYYTCAKAAYEQMITILEGGKISVPMRKVSLLLFSIGLAMFLVFIFAYADRSKSYNTKPKHTVFEDAKPKRNVTLVKKVKINERRVLRSSSSSRGGGYSGGGRSVGGHSGGGGGHSF